MQCSTGDECTAVIRINAAIKRQDERFDDLAALVRAVALSVDNLANELRESSAARDKEVVELRLNVVKMEGVVNSYKTLGVSLIGIFGVIAAILQVIFK